MNKNLLIAALFAATSANAAMTITGDYEGTFTDGSGATYSQDLDLTLVGSTDGAKVTMMMEDITGETALTTSQVFVEADVEGIAIKAGNYKNQNGSGLMQTDSAITNQFAVSTSIAGAGITLGQVSGDSNVTVDASMEVAGLDVTVQNVTATDRFITVVANFFGFGVTAETQNTTVGRNTAVSAGATIGYGVDKAVDLTAVVVDVNDATAITQNDGILGDVTGANNGSTIVGGVASMGTTFGVVTGKAFEVNDATTYVGEVQRGALTVGYTKADDTAGVTSAKIDVSF